MIIGFLLIFLKFFFSILHWSIFLKIIASWFIMFGVNFFRKIDEIVTPITNPLFAPFRWAKIGMLDFSPIVALIVLDIIGGILKNLLTKYM